MRGHPCRKAVPRVKARYGLLAKQQRLRLERAWAAPPDPQRARTALWSRRGSCRRPYLWPAGSPRCSILLADAVDALAASCGVAGGRCTWVAGAANAGSGARSYLSLLKTSVTERLGQGAQWLGRGRHAVRASRQRSRTAARVALCTAVGVGGAAAALAPLAPDVVAASGARGGAYCPVDSSPRLSVWSSGVPSRGSR